MRILKSLNSEPKEINPSNRSADFAELWLVRTESVLAAASQGWFTLENSESPEFIGRVIAALADDPHLSERSGTVVVAGAAALDLGVTDVDGKQPSPLTLDRA